MPANPVLTLSMCLLILLSAGSASAEEEGKPPPLWGYGVKSCDEFVIAKQAWEDGREQGVAEYRRYQDWLSGFISGLNLATGQDVLVGVDLEAAMRRIHLYCSDNRRKDFFTGSMDLVRLLSKLR